MSRLNDLLRRLDASDPDLAKDLRREVDALADRRSFGLNFERHVPEAVELPGRPVRKGDKVRVLAPRGSRIAYQDERLWRVIGITKNDEGTRNASLELLAGGEQSTSLVDDLIVVAEFRDPIYPGLVSTGTIERGDGKPFHTVINAENYHALQTLLFTHRGKVDCIYIDPPYNTGAKDWKYNNDYVEGDDLYRHSKWLAFMERRLLLAQELLNPKDSVLIVTIDEKEYLRTGLLLEQTFPDARIQMVSSIIAQKGVARSQQFYRTDEYIFFVAFGSAAVAKLALADEWQLGKGTSAAAGGVVWSQLRRAGTNSLRTDRPRLFYPIYIDPTGPRIVGAGDPLSLSANRSTVAAPDGAIIAWPLRPDGVEANWQISPTALMSLVTKGFVRIGRANANGYPISYLKRGSIEKIEQSLVAIAGRDPVDGHVLLDSGEYEHTFIPGTQWNISSHDATYHGSQLLNKLIGQGRFSFPKSVYAVEDALRFYVDNKKNAVVVDFFAGSGTTAHAVMRLNRADGGARQSILVTNNEVSSDEVAALRTAGFRPGDDTWESKGIFRLATEPRIRAAALGVDKQGIRIDGDYKFGQQFPIAEGFAENVEFFTLTHEAPLRVSSNREFRKVAPLLWMRAGSRGRRIEDISAGWDVADSYGVVADLDQSGQFVKAVAASGTITHAFIVTDEDRLFEAVVRELPEGVEPVRLYEAYMRNFEIETGRSVL
ncbi:site-specific DNA-methyltransferase [Kineococcus sp. R86509]|uniref:site-specific DNA-methyltransferase n=1 Tax=Kineococcus sp. R86509 TaxID=3093851 RepID=UPI0036D2D37F